MSRTDDIDLSQTIAPAKAAKRIAKAQRRLVELRLITAGLLEPYEEGPGLVVLFEGFDAAGKGGAIRRVTEPLDPRQFRVVPIAEPTPVELSHHFLWRFQPFLPGRGDMTVFDRSWYGRLLVERVEHLIDDATAERSAKEIVEFERMLISNGTTLLKFWLHVSDAEQLKRFQHRAADPLKHWKLTADDWRNREHRAAYEHALRQMVDATDHPRATWHLISGEDKPYARVTVLETLVAEWEKDLKRRGVDTEVLRVE